MMARFSNPLVREAVALLAAHGFVADVRNGGKHIKVKWLDHGRRFTLVIARSPSDRRAVAKSRATLRRLLRANGRSA